MTLQADFIAKKEELAVKRTALAELFKTANATTDETKRHELGESIKQANTELADLVDAIGPLQELVVAEEENRKALKALRRPVDRQIEPDTEIVDRDMESSDEVVSAGFKSVHDLFRSAMESKGIKSARDGGEGFRGFRGVLGELAVKTLITSADLTPQAQRLPAIQLSAQEERTVSDLMLSGTTSAQKIEYFEETTFTNAAAETAESDPKPEAALDFTLREDAVRKIATWVPVTDEMLADVPAFESYLRERLGFMVKQREERQLLRGSGSGINIRGLYNRTGVQAVSGAGITNLDSILLAVTEIAVDALAEATAMVIHPRDWFDVRTSKDLNGQYLLGPATSGADVRPWGLEVRSTTAAPENTALVGAFRPHAQVFRRSGIEIAISTENEDFFIKNKLAVRAEERLALAVYRPSAFCKVTHLVSGS